MPGKIISDDLLEYFITIFDYWTILGIICLGLITNMLNLIVFAHQGYKDGVNISMTCIALWDFLRCLAGLVDRMYKPIGLVSPALGLSYKNTVTLFLAYTHILAGYASYALATYVSIERCLCVCMPFTVKSVFTPKFTLVMVTAISVIIFGAYVVICFIWEIAQVYSPEFNTTIAVYVYSDFYDQYGFIVLVYYQIMAIILPFTSFLILCVCSIVTVYYLKKSSDPLRKTDSLQFSGKDGGTTGVSQREKRVVKMLLVVIGVYIGNLFPEIISFIVQLTEPEFYVKKLYNNIFLLYTIFVFLLDDLNASVNFFIFVSMSSNFKATFQTLFPITRKCF